MIGLLDIYGFEIFETNSFEQLSINYCNEKLQQLFIELTLKQEQEEYFNENIQWEPVKYFNNKIICDLIEARHKGIIDILDEECLRPGEATDSTFLSKLSATIGRNERFVTHELADPKVRKTLSYDEFRLQHYAGNVTYNVKKFLDKNNDLLYRNLKEMLTKSNNKIVNEMFTLEELQRKKRPETVGTQFRRSLNDLMKILMSKEPSYVRCIKPNNTKSSRIFDEKLVQHQVKYLGLMENLRVRRAGFAYRRVYENFYKRYKSLCSATWPHYEGSTKEAVKKLCEHLQYGEEDYRLGVTKIFIRKPQTLFFTEELFQQKKHELATSIQSLYKGYVTRVKYQKMRQAVTIISSHWKRVLATRLKVKRKKAALDIRKFIVGFQNRNQPRSDLNAEFLDFVRFKYLNKCRELLPTSVLDKSWPKAPPSLDETKNLLMKLNMKNLTLKYVKNCSPKKKFEMEEKLLASQIFKGKKDNYESTISKPFRSGSDNIVDSKHITSILNGEKPLYACLVTKYDRHGYKERERTLTVTKSGTYLFDSKSNKLKDYIPHPELTGVSCSGHNDNLFVLHRKLDDDDKNNKGDVIVTSTMCIESITKIASEAKIREKIKIVSNNEGIIHKIDSNKEGQIEFLPGSISSIKKSKNGNLLVTT